MALGAVISLAALRSTHMAHNPILVLGAVRTRLSRKSGARLSGKALTPSSRSPLARHDAKGSRS